jgi:hypothetical protein
MRKTERPLVLSRVNCRWQREYVTDFTSTPKCTANVGPDFKLNKPLDNTSQHVTSPSEDTAITATEPATENNTSEYFKVRRRAHTQLHHALEMSEEYGVYNGDSDMGCVMTYTMGFVCVSLKVSVPGDARMLPARPSPIYCHTRRPPANSTARNVTSCVATSSSEVVQTIGAGKN